MSVMQCYVAQQHQVAGRIVLWSLLGIDPQHAGVDVEVLWGCYGGLPV